LARQWQARIELKNNANTVFVLLQNWFESGLLPLVYRRFPLPLVALMEVDFIVNKTAMKSSVEGSAKKSGLGN
jgi:hypothetical protein